MLSSKELFELKYGKLEMIKEDIQPIYLYIHADEIEQKNFILEARGTGNFANPVRFRMNEGALLLGLINHKFGHENNKINLANRIVDRYRAYITISTANPDKIGNYFNWCDLEDSLSEESGWFSKFVYDVNK